MRAGVTVRRQLSRRGLLTLIWVGAFLVLGLVGLRAHSAEPATVPIVAESNDGTISSAHPNSTFAEGGDHATHRSAQNSHIDLLAVCMLSILVTLMLVVLFTRRPWLHLRLGKIRNWVIVLPRAAARPQPLLLLHSISRI